MIRQKEINVKSRYIGSKITQKKSQPAGRIRDVVKMTDRQAYDSSFLEPLSRKISNTLWEI